jgi:hypothetical protein
MFKSIYFAAVALCAVAFLPVVAAAQQDKPFDPASNPSGMYSFLRDGEFVQITLDGDKLSGFISRFGDSDTDKEQFLDQFFDKASLQGQKISFTTKTVHSEWFEFSGTITVNAGKKPGQEAYRTIRGTLTQHTADAKGVDKTTQKQVEFKSFPSDASQ